MYETYTLVRLRYRFGYTLTLNPHLSFFLGSHTGSVLNAARNSTVVRMRGEAPALTSPMYQLAGACFVYPKHVTVLKSKRFS